MFSYMKSQCGIVHIVTKPAETQAAFDAQFPPLSSSSHFQIYLWPEMLDLCIDNTNAFQVKGS